MAFASRGWLVGTVMRARKADCMYPADTMLRASHADAATGTPTESGRVLTPVTTTTKKQR
jgi:hypothetical protein